MKKTWMVLALALSLPACSLLAQNDGPPGGGPPDGGFRPGGPGGPGRGHRPPAMAIIMALDTNHDGIISADEIANAPKALLTLDKNGDGQLTRDEYMGPPPPRPGMTNADGQGAPPPPPDDAAQGAQGRPRRPVPPIIAALDTNHDGIISADEIANAAASLLKLDKNGDGQLTRDEFAPRPPRPQMSADGQNGPDNGPPPPPPDDGNGPGDGAPPPPDQNN